MACQLSHPVRRYRWKPVSLLLFFILIRCSPALQVICQLPLSYTVYLTTTAIGRNRKVEEIEAALCPPSDTKQGVGTSLLICIRLVSWTNLIMLWVQSMWLMEVTSGNTWALKLVGIVVQLLSKNRPCKCNIPMLCWEHSSVRLSSNDVLPQKGL